MLLFSWLGFAVDWLALRVKPQGLLVRIHWLEVPVVVVKPANTALNQRVGWGAVWRGFYPSLQVVGGVHS